MPYFPNTIYHIYNQGNNRQPIFFREKNYWLFMAKMKQHLCPYADILCYALMPNHFHWLVQVNESGCALSNAVKPRNKFSNSSAANGPDYQQNISHGIAVLLRSYTRAINVQEERSGSLFRKNTKAKTGMITEFVSRPDSLVNAPRNNPLFYPRICFRYIHQNPVKAGFVNAPEEYRHSSAFSYKYNLKQTICNVELGRTLFEI